VISFTPAAGELALAVEGPGSYVDVSTITFAPHQAAHVEAYVNAPKRRNMRIMGNYTGIAALACTSAATANLQAVPGFNKGRRHGAQIAGQRQVELDEPGTQSPGVTIADPRCSPWTEDQRRHQKPSDPAVTCFDQGTVRIAATGDWTRARFPYFSSESRGCREAAFYRTAR